MTDQQPKALRLAELLESCSLHVGDSEQAEAAAELRRLHRVELARNEWITKTEWVQQAAHPRELGMHRADVMRKRIERLQAENEQLRSALAEATLQHDTAQSTEADDALKKEREAHAETNRAMTDALLMMEEREQRDEALLRQALEALELRCGTHADERKELIPALRERLGVKEQADEQMSLI